MPIDTAIVTVSVAKAQFYRLNATHKKPRLTACSPATFTLQQPWPAGVSQLITGTLVVQKKYLKGNGIVFLFDLTGSGYTPLAVGLQQKGGKIDPQGFTNFPPGLRRPSGASGYKITDVVHDHGKPGSWVWAVSIPVQDSLGNGGLLDPDIENQD